MEFQISWSGVAKPAAVAACPVLSEILPVLLHLIWGQEKAVIYKLSSPASVIKGVHKQLGTSNHLIHFKSLQGKGNNYGAPIWLVLAWSSVNQSCYRIFKNIFPKDFSKTSATLNSSPVQDGMAREQFGFPSTLSLCMKPHCLKVPYRQDPDYKLEPDSSSYHIRWVTSPITTQLHSSWQRPRLYV